MSAKILSELLKAHLKKIALNPNYFGGFSITSYLAKIVGNTLQ